MGFRRRDRLRARGCYSQPLDCRPGSDRPCNRPGHRRLAHQPSQNTDDAVHRRRAVRQSRLLAHRRQADVPPHSRGPQLGKRLLLQGVHASIPQHMRRTPDLNQRGRNQRRGRRLPRRSSARYVSYFAITSPPTMLAEGAFLRKPSPATVR